MAPALEARRCNVMGPVLEALAQLPWTLVHLTKGSQRRLQVYFGGVVRPQQRTASASAFPAALENPRRFLTPAAVRLSNHGFAVRRRHLGRRKRSSCAHPR